METAQTVESVHGNRWFIGYFFSNLASGLISPLIPLYVLLYLKLSVLYVGIASAIVSTASVPVLILWGNLSDRYGRRKVFIVLGFVGGGASLFGVMFASNIWLFVGILSLFQIIVMASVPVATMIIIENSARESWPNVISRFNMVASVGNVVGLAAGAISIVWVSLDAKMLVFLYIAAGAVYILAGLMVHLLIPEPVKKIQRKRLASIYSVRIVEKLRFFPSNMIHIISPRQHSDRSISGATWGFLASCAFLMFAFQVFFVPFPAYMIDIQKSSDLIIYLMYLGNAVLGAFSYRFSGRVVNSLGPGKVLLGSLLTRGIIFGIAAILALAYVLGSATVFSLIIMYSVLGGIWSLISISQLTILSNNVKTSVKGRAIGYYNSLTGVGQIMAALAAGYLSEILGYGVTFSLSVMFLAISGVFLMKAISSMSGKKRGAAGATAPA